MATTLTIAAASRTAYIRAGSMTCRLNSLDLVLVDPPSTPAIGDAVVLTDPAWSGTVAKVEKSDPADRQGHLLVTVSATNTNAATASAAPFGLSDTPDNATTYGYRRLRVATQRNTDGTTTTQGSCEVQRAGLWPAMTFNLTSANIGYAGASFSVRNVTVTWPTASSPVYAVEFGDPIVTMSVWVASKAADAPDGSISGTKITDLSVTTPKIAAGAIGTTQLAAGSITLYDEFGSAVLLPSGWAGSWADFSALGLYNGGFAAIKQPSGSLLADGRSSDLPYWTIARSGINSVQHIFGLVVINYSAVNGWASLTSDVVSVAEYEFYVPELNAFRGGTAGAGTVRFDVTVSFYKSDMTWLSDANWTTRSLNSGNSRIDLAPARAPAYAKYARLKMTATADAYNAGMAAVIRALGFRSVGSMVAPTKTIYAVHGTSTYTPPVGLAYAIVECVGAGGAGGGSASTAGGASKGGGGGAGGYSRSIVTAAAIGDSQTVTVGTGGTGVSGGTGNAGGDSSFGAIVIAKGGSGAGMNSSTTTAVYGVAGGAGGVAGTGDVAAPGGRGQHGLSGGLLGIGGNGGGTLFGEGGNGGVVATAPSAQAGGAGTGNGAGGGGSLTTSTGSAQAGGAGADGIVIITEFYGA